MANKFQKGVLERLEQESSRQSVTPSHKKEVVKKPPKQEAKKVIMDVSENSLPTPKRKSSKNDTLSQYLNRNQQRQAKNKTFYLDVEVIDAIHNASKKYGLAESRLVNDILRGILITQEDESH